MAKPAIVSEAKAMRPMWVSWGWVAEQSSGEGARDGEAGDRERSEGDAPDVIVTRPS